MPIKNKNYAITLVTEKLKGTKLAGTVLLIGINFKHQKFSAVLVVFFFKARKLVTPLSQ